MENNLNGIRRLSLNVDSEEGFKAKPVHIYDVCLDEKEYKKMLSDKRKFHLTGSNKFGNMRYTYSNWLISQ